MTSPVNTVEKDVQRLPDGKLPAGVVMQRVRERQDFLKQRVTLNVTQEIVMLIDLMIKQIQDDSEGKVKLKRPQAIDQAVRSCLQERGVDYDAVIYHVDDVT